MVRRQAGPVRCLHAGEEEPHHRPHRAFGMREIHPAQEHQQDERSGGGMQDRGTDAVPRRGPVRPRRGSERTEDQDRHDLPEAEPLPHVDQGQHHLRSQDTRGQGQGGAGRDRGVLPPEGRPLRRGGGPPGQVRPGPVRRAAAEAVHRQGAFGEPRGAADGRAHLRAGPHRHLQDRGPGHRAEEGLHRGNRHSQHAAGVPHQRLHRLHVPGQDDRVRGDRAAFQQTQRGDDREVPHREIRVISCRDSSTT